MSKCSPDRRAEKGKEENKNAEVLKQYGINVIGFVRLVVSRSGINLHYKCRRRIPANRNLHCSRESPRCELMDIEWAFRFRKSLRPPFGCRSRPFLDWAAYEMGQIDLSSASRDTRGARRDINNRGSPWRIKLSCETTTTGSMAGARKKMEPMHEPVSTRRQSHDMRFTEILQTNILELLNLGCKVQGE